MILLHGNDSYLLKQALATACSDMRSRGTVVLDSIDGSSPDAGVRLSSAIASRGLFGEHQAIVLSDAVMIPDLKELLRQAGPELDIIAVQDITALDAAGKRRLEGIRKLATTSTVHNTPPARELTGWMTAFCEVRGRRLVPAAAAELVRRAGSDSWALANELEKLCAYAETDVDETAVHMLVSIPIAYDEWELSNALSAGDKRAALMGLWRRLRSGTPEYALVGLVASATRTLLAVHDGARRGLSAAAIATAAGLHPFVVRKSLHRARGADADALRKAHIGIARLDRDSKRGKADLLDGLFGAILSMR